MKQKKKEDNYVFLLFSILFLPVQEVPDLKYPEEQPSQWFPPVLFEQKVQNPVWASHVDDNPLHSQPKTKGKGKREKGKGKRQRWSWKREREKGKIER